MDAQNPKLIGVDSQTILTTLRTPDTISFPNIDKITTLKPYDGGAESTDTWFIKNNTKGDTPLYKNIYDYWRNQSYSSGNRINDKSLKVEVLDSQHVKVSMICNPLWTNGYSHSLTPDEPIHHYKDTWFWQTVSGQIPVTDTLTIRDGKIIKRETNQNRNLWIIDPYLSNWAADMLPNGALSSSQIDMRQKINPARQIKTDMWGVNEIDAPKGALTLKYTFYPIHGAFPVDELKQRVDDNNLDMLNLGRRGIWTLPVNDYKQFPEIMQTLKDFGEL